MSELDDIRLPENFESAKQLAPAHLQSHSNKRNEETQLVEVTGRDYCIGIGGPGMIKICRRDPNTGKCGYLECVDIPRRSLL